MTNPLVCVVGDLMVDHYIWGLARRLSPEAPVPVVAAEGEESRVGGAALVAANICAFGTRTKLFGAVGQDAEGDWLLDALQQHGVDTDGISRLDDRTTTLKTRVMASGHQLGRFDREKTHPVPELCWRETLDGVQRACRAGCRHVVVSSYDKGMMTAERVTELLALRESYPELQVLIDPKRLPWASLRGAAVVKPNRTELAAALGCPVDFSWEETSEAADELRRRCGIDTLVVTLGGEGIAALSDESRLLAPAMRVEVHDVTGAGDAVLAGLVWGATNGWSWPQRLAFANRCGALTVSKSGTVVLTEDQLSQDGRWEGAPPGVIDLVKAIEVVEAWHTAGEVVVLTNGCYDLLHAGHVQLLEAAKAHGTKLVVAVNTDASVRRLKGPERPVVSQDDRGQVLVALRSVDAVVFFEDDTPIHVIEALRPDVLCKGADYQLHEVVGAELVQSWNGTVALLPLKVGSSTSSLIERILESKGE